MSDLPARPDPLPADPPVAPPAARPVPPPPGRPIPPPPGRSSLPPPPPGRPAVVVGKVVEVTVTAVHEREVEVRLADGRTGVVGRREFESAPVVGAVVPAALLARDDPKGRVALSHEWARKQLLWDSMDAAKAEHTALRGTLTSVVKGGAVVDLGLRAFLPASMVGEQPGADPQPLVGTEIDVMVLEVDRAKDRLVVSRRDFLRRERRATERAAYSSLKVGTDVPGTVVSVADFGAVVDLGGVRGLVHRSELTWGHLGSVEDVVSVGDVVTVKVLDVNRSKKKVSLSLRQTQSDPLEGLEVGEVYDGKVTRVVEYGCFVKVESTGAEGLVHLTELTEVGGYRPDQLVSPGERVRVKVLDVDRAKRRVSLSARQAAY